MLLPAIFDIYNNRE